MTRRHAIVVAFLALCALLAAPAPAYAKRPRPQRRVHRIPKRHKLTLRDINRDNYPAGETFEQHQKRAAKDRDKQRRDYNCYNCALALDATLAGHPACALTTGPELGNAWFRDRFNGGRVGLIVPNIGRVVLDGDDVRVRNVDVPPQRILEHAMKQHGPGARAIVIGYFSEDGVEMSHTFNAVNQRGKVKLLDAQTGQPAVINDVYRFFELIRTDKRADTPSATR